MFEKLKEWDVKTLDSIKTFLFFMVVVDLLGVWWYLQWKKLGMALMMVILGCLGLVMYLRSQKEQIEDKKQEEKPIESKEKEPEGFLGLNLGLPSAEDYEKRLKEAVGS